LLRKVNAAEVAVALVVTYNAVEPKLVPPELASRCTVLKEIFTVVVAVVAVKFIPRTCGAVFAAVTLEFGALKSPILLYILALFAVPEVTEIPKQVVAAVPLASILYILLLNIDGALELLNKLSQYCHWLKLSEWY
jgi:hypothetical protein